jgi:RNA polymerase sigma factor (sigma-70 family)
MVQIYKQYRQGQKISELAARFNRTRVAIHRGITRCWAAEILSRKISYIPSLEFESAQAQQAILGQPLALASEPQKGVLARPREQQLFCRYNYLKYLAESLRGRITQDNASLQTLKKIDKLLDEAEQIRRFLVEVNMPLVAGIAGKHLTTGGAMSELVSEGAVSMMRAVDKFDYTRGYRFSTYASWVIAKDFARKIPAESAGWTALQARTYRIQRRCPLRTAGRCRLAGKSQPDLRQVIDNTLDERERYVVMNHFAIDSGVIRKKAQDTQTDWR